MRRFHSPSPGTHAELAVVFSGGWVNGGVAGHGTRMEGQARQVNARTHHTLVMVRIDTDRVRLQIKRVLAVFHLLQLVLVEIRPAPDPGVDDVREAFSTGHLETPVQRALNRDALGRVGAIGGDSGDEAVQFVPLFLQLLDQTLDSPLAEGFRLSSLPVAHQRVDDAEAGVGRGGGPSGTAAPRTTGTSATAARAGGSWLGPPAGASSAAPTPGATWWGHGPRIG